MFFNINGGRSQIYSSDTSQGPRRRCFLALMVDAPGSPAPAPPRGTVVDNFNIDGVCSGFTAPAPLRGHDIDISYP
jgi:hypothetical protein